MEEVLNALKKIQKELDEQRETIRESAKNVTEQVTNNINNIFQEKICNLEENQEKLKQIVENQEKRIYYIEKQVRQRNIVFFGIEERETSYENLENNIIKWIKEHFSIELLYSDIQEVKRIGKRGDRPRPIIVTFSTLGLKIKIFKQKEILKNTHYYIKEDYPKYVIEKRKELQVQLKVEREKGNIAKIKYDKLIIIKNNNKRTLPTSPENNLQPQIEKNIQVNKKNKTEQSRPSVRRSSSISEGVVKPGMLNFLVNKNVTNKNNKQEDRDKTT